MNIFPRLICVNAAVKGIGCQKRQNCFRIFEVNISCKIHYINYWQLLFISAHSLEVGNVSFYNLSRELRDAAVHNYQVIPVKN